MATYKKDIQIDNINLHHKVERTNLIGPQPYISRYRECVQLVGIYIFLRGEIPK